MILFIAFAISFRFAFLPTTLRTASDDERHAVFWALVANTMVERY